MTSKLLATDLCIAVNTVDGIPYYYASATSAGEFSTGPCHTPQEAVNRLCDYHAGKEIAETPPAIYSAETLACVISVLGSRPLLQEQLGSSIGRAFIAGPASDAWLRASEIIGRWSRCFPDLAFIPRRTISKK